MPPVSLRIDSSRLRAMGEAELSEFSQHALCGIDKMAQPDSALAMLTSSTALCAVADALRR